MKKIIFYLPSLSPSGGIERVVTTIANQLSEKLSITILTQDNSPSFYELKPSIKHDFLNSYFNLDMNNKLKRILSQIKSVYRSSQKLSDYLKCNKFDYIYITNPNSQLELLLSGVNKNKIVISEHGASNNYNIIYRCIKKLTYKKCRFYCVPTKYDLDFYLKKGFPVKYTPHYQPSLNYQNANIDSKIVLNVGRFTDDKKQLVLLNIWNEIEVSKRLGWKLKIVGCGELKIQLQNFINKNKLNESVLLIPPQKDISSIYKNASIFALTSRSEGFGMVLLEAAGFGLPLISFNCPAGPRDIINNNNGYLVDVDDNESYKNKLIEMMNNKSLLIDFMTGSKQLINDWSNEKISNIWMSVFK